MDYQTYERIIESLKAYPWGDLDKIQSELCLEYPEVSEPTIRSILCQEYQRHVKAISWSERSDHNRRMVYTRVMQAVDNVDSDLGEIVRLTSETGASPAETAKLVLDTHYDGDKVSQLKKNTTLIDNGRLAMEVMLANLKDESYGHIADAIKHSIGEEHEQKLKDILTKLEIPYSDEHVLRSLGYDKTPDIKLDIPIAVDGFIVNWIESKALFGDPEAHQGYLRDQLWSYLNRFGSGMVIYWSGYVSSLDNNRSYGIMLSDRFPEQFTRYKPELVRSNSQGSDAFK